MTIYFDENKNSYGFVIGNCIATTTDENWADYAHTDKWDIVNGVFTDITDTPEYIIEQEAVEKERIGKLYMTKLDFVKALSASGVTYAQLKVVLATSEDAQTAWELCNNIYRNHPLLDSLCLAFGMTPELIDGLFVAVDDKKKDFRGIHNVDSTT